MKKNLLLLLCLLSAGIVGAQANYDYETDESSVTFTYFGSSLEAMNTEVIDNPNATGVNTSAKVGSYIKAAGSETWAGAYANPLPEAIATVVDAQICVDVHFDHMGNLALKLENATNGVSNWITTQETTVMNEWETLCFDLNANGLEDAMTPAAGGIFEGLVLFFDFGSNDPDNDVTSYFDNIRYIAPSNDECGIVFDFEDGGSTATYRYFGSSLQDQDASIIDNPNPTGNESAKVLEYVKAANSEVWAGAYSVDGATVDATTGTELCIDVHMDHIGNIGLKLEQSSTIGNWIQTAANTVINEWETICIDLSLNGLEDDMTPAAGHIFSQLVVFPDFGSSFDTDQVYYLDNMCVKSSGTGASYDVTFRVDMNNYAGSFTQPYVSGTFNGWSADANPLADDDLDGVWETTLNLPTGTIEYKFQVDQWADQDMFLASDECVVVFTDDQGQTFINREAFIAADDPLGTVCFGSCYACGEEISITWNLNMNNEDVSDLGVYVAGGPFGHAELPAMTDDDGDGIFTTTIRRMSGFDEDYTFLNGICLPSWECKENIAGQDCAVDPFNDRHVGPVFEDTVISTCFGQCTETTECETTTSYTATFRVDMNAETVAADGVYVAGGVINGWNPTATPLSDDNGDGIWEVTVELPATVVEYKFLNGDGGWEDLAAGDCTLETGGYINRVFTMEEKDTILNAYVFNSCDITPVANKETIIEDAFTLNPTVTADFTFLKTANTDAKTIEVYNLNGQLVQQLYMSAGQQELMIDVTDISAGMYIVNMRTENFVSTKRMVVR